MFIKSLKGQMILSFIFIIIVSLAATIVTYFGGYKLFQTLENKKLYPANHFERQIPHIEQEMRKQGARILKDKHLIQRVIPSKGIKYQVIDANGLVMYGTYPEQIVNDKHELLTKWNTTIHTDNWRGKVIPIIEGKKIEGALILLYQIQVHFSSEKDGYWIIPLFVMIILSPFIYIILFTIIFSRRFANSIKKPINLLIDASKKIRQKDLDFSINYKADNELGELCSAFEAMKSELQVSLIQQWKIEQERYEILEALAHDLKTPFAVIQGYADSLLDDHVINDPQQKTYIEVIREHAFKGSGLTKELLYAMELEAATLEVQAVPIQIESFIEDKIASHELLSKQKNIHFKVDVEYVQGAKKLINIDLMKLERIVDNLIANSLQYTPDFGEISIHISVTDLTLHFIICDTGTGFSNKDLAKIFSKFYRGDESRSTKDGHVGLGLYIVKKLVELQGGTVRAYNGKTGGACVEFKIKQLV